MNLRASPVVVRCLTCAAAVDASLADTCPFCGTSLASMPVIEPEPDLADIEPIAAAPQVTALAIVPKRRRRKRRWALLLVLAAAGGAAFVGRDLRLSAHNEAPARMPSIAIPVVSTEPPPAAPTAAPATPAASPDSPEPAAAQSSAPQGCDFFTTQEIDREYAFARGRADVKLQRAQQINDHYFALDHDKKAHDARAKAAAGEHAATIAQLDASLARARSACDAGFLS